METKISFRFDGDIEEDRYKMERVMKSDEMAMSLHDILRNVFKEAEHQAEDKDMTADEMLDLVKEKTVEVLDDNSINIDDLIF